MFPLRWNFPFRKKDGSLSTIQDEIDSGGGGGYTLPTASASTKGGVKIGAGLTMDGEVLKNTNPTPYSLPTASDETLGGIKVGSGLSIVDGVLSAAGGGGGGFHLYRFTSSNFGFSAGYVISNYDDGSTAGSTQTSKNEFKKALFNGIGFMTVNDSSKANVNLGIITISSATAASANVIKDTFTISDNNIVITKGTNNPEFSYMNNFSYVKDF